MAAVTAVPELVERYGKGGALKGGGKREKQSLLSADQELQPPAKKYTHPGPISVPRSQKKIYPKKKALVKSASRLSGPITKFTLEFFYLKYYLC